MGIEFISVPLAIISGLFIGLWVVPKLFFSPADFNIIKKEVYPSLIKNSFKFFVIAALVVIFSIVIAIISRL